MKIKNITKFASYILGGLILTSPINSKANTPIENVLEKSYDELDELTEIKNGVTIIENNNQPKITKEIVIDNNSLYDIGSIVVVDGNGASASTEQKTTTKKFANQLMAIVKVKEGTNYPYALAILNDDNSVGDIVGWFKKDSIKACYVISTITEFADIQKTIIDTEDIPASDNSSWEFLNQYYDYSDGKSIQVKYIWPEVEENYDQVYTTKFEDNIQTKEFYKDSESEEYFYYFYDWKNGTVTHTTEENKVLVPKRITKK